MSVSIVPAYDRAEDVRVLFSEYTDMLVAFCPAFSGYLALQNFDEEIAHLDKKYGFPFGRLYLACVDSQPAGCIALRKLDDERCEMKRLYVRDCFRGLRIGSLLLERIVDDARNIGYKAMLLDTLPFLKSALHLYEKFGFRKIGCYNDSPIPETIFMKLDLEDR